MLFICGVTTAQTAGSDTVTTPLSRTEMTVSPDDTRPAIPGTSPELHPSVTPSEPDYTPPAYDEHILHTSGSDALLSESALSAPNDSLTLPSLNRYGQMRLCSFPIDLCGNYDWQLHRGLNLSIGASVFATFGKHFHSTGFGQNITAMYATPLNNRLTLAVGGYFNNIYWNSTPCRDAGLSAVLGYRFDEHWEAYIYGQKSIMNNRMPMPIYDMSDIGDRIGAAVRYNINENMSIQVSVSTGETHHPHPRPHDIRP